MRLPVSKAWNERRMIYRSAKNYSRQKMAVTNMSDTSELLGVLRLLHPRPGVWRTPTIEEEKAIENIISRIDNKSIGGY